MTKDEKVPTIERDRTAIKVKTSDVPRRLHSDFRRVYASNANLLSSFFDLSLIFGTVHQDRDSPAGILIEDQVLVAMSWEHAKSLEVALQKILREYEAEHGHIREFPSNVGRVEPE